MVSMQMMQAMAIYPGDRIYIESQRVIHDRDGFYEPILIVERTMSDSQVQNVGQIHTAKKPTKNKINRANQHPPPRSQMSWGEIHTCQHVEQNNRIADDIVCFHDGSAGSFKQKSGWLSNNKLRHQSCACDSAVLSRIPRS